MEHRLRHRSASGGFLENLFDIDDDDRLLCSIRVASGPLVHVSLVVKNVRVRNRAHFEFGCWPLGATREQWRVEHGVLDGYLPPPHPLLPAMTLLLTNTPAEIAAKLARITAE